MKKQSLFILTLMLKKSKLLLLSGSIAVVIVAGAALASSQSFFGSFENATPPQMTPPPAQPGQQPGGQTPPQDGSSQGQTGSDNPEDVPFWCMKTCPSGYSYNWLKLNESEGKDVECVKNDDGDEGEYIPNPEDGNNGQPVGGYKWKTPGENDKTGLVPKRPLNEKPMNERNPKNNIEKPGIKNLWGLIPPKDNKQNPPENNGGNGTTAGQDPFGGNNGNSGNKGGSVPPMNKPDGYDEYYACGCDDIAVKSQKTGKTFLCPEGYGDTATYTNSNGNKVYVEKQAAAYCEDKWKCPAGYIPSTWFMNQCNPYEQAKKTKEARCNKEPVKPMSQEMKDFCKAYVPWMSSMEKDAMKWVNAIPCISEERCKQYEENWKNGKYGPKGTTKVDGMDAGAVSNACSTFYNIYVPFTAPPPPKKK